jgi:hypothetical protein
VFAIRILKIDKSLLTYLDILTSVIKGLCVLTLEKRLANKVKSVRTAIELITRYSKAYFVSNYTYYSVIVIGVVKHKVTNCK